MLIFVGRVSVAMHYLGNQDMRITRDRGKWFKTKGGFDCIATYHPAYLLRQTGKFLVQSKWDVYYDLKAAKEKVETAMTDYQFSSGKPINLFDLFTKR